jgi:glycosyltransferase involved in cell wall biosynthesis
MCVESLPSVDSVSVVTVVLNDPVGLQRTIESVITQTHANIEFIVIDGGSRNETLAVIERYRDAITSCVSEPDKGIYDAMNKGIRLATCEWYILMNAGDVFATVDTVARSISQITASGASWGGGASKIMLPGGLERVCENAPPRSYHQQSVFVKKSLHLKYGYYIVNTGSKAWDFFFFNLLDDEPFHSVEGIIAVCDGTGVSSSVSNYLDVVALKFLFRRTGSWQCATMLMLYPFYRRWKVAIAWLRGGLLG